jgi:4-hydroxybenzoyl-CoA thioesterase
VEDWVDEGLGVGYRRLIIERRIGLPTVHLEAEFLAVSRMGDRVSLGVDVARLGGRSLSLDLRCVGTGQDGSEEERMRIRQVLVTTSLETHRSIDVPAELRLAIERGTVGHASGPTDEPSSRLGLRVAKHARPCAVISAFLGMVARDPLRSFIPASTQTFANQSCGSDLSAARASSLRPPAVARFDAA